MLSTVSIICFLIGTIRASSIQLPSYPLAVKSPYLHTWLPGNEAHDAATATPQFWQGQSLSWMVMARVGGETYKLFGCPDLNATKPHQTALEFSSTHTIITSQSELLTFSLDFFSPVDLDDYVRQSLPYSYLTVTVEGASGSSLEIFSAIDGSWTGQNQAPQTTRSTLDDIEFFTLSPHSPITFAEVNQTAQWGEWVFASRTGSADNKSCGQGSPSAMLHAFKESGNLSFVSDSEPAATDLVACSVGFGSSPGNASTTFIIGLHQDYLINYMEEDGMKPQIGYYRSKFDTVEAAVPFVFDDYDNALSKSTILDQRIRELGAELGQNYTDILESNVLQSFGGWQLTISAETRNTSTAFSFIKEISTNGNMNTIADLIPKAAPIFYVLAPDYIRLMLEPIMVWSQHSWPINHAVHDIGKHYPNATGETPCEEEFLALDSATVLIWMMAAHVKLTGDVDWVNRWSNLLRDYADYCVNYGLYPVLQRSSMDSVGAATNQTALSVSAAIALNAYGQMTGLENYTQIAKYFVSVIMDVGMDSNHSHFLIHYGDVDESYILMYPLAFDRLLGLETFPYSTDDTMSAWYIRNEREYGLPFSSDVTYTLMEFEMWAAAVSSPEAKDLFINSIHKFLIHQTGATDSVPGPTQWNVTGEVGIGKWSRFSKAKSIVGSVFMPTAVSHSNKTNGIAEAAAQGNYVASIPVRRDRWQFHSDQNAKPSSQSVGGFDLAAPMPQNASQEVNNSFAGVSIEMSSLPAYLGTSNVNAFSQNLVMYLQKLAGGNFTIRIGGDSAQTSTFDPGQDQAIVPASTDSACDVSDAITIGTGFYSSIKSFQTSDGLRYIYTTPFAFHASKVDNAVNQSQAIVDAVGLQQIDQFAIGNHPLRIDTSGAWGSYTCQNYSKDFIPYYIAIAGNISGLDLGGFDGRTRAFQALEMPSGYYGNGWSAEECFIGGIDAMHHVKTYASHYYPESLETSSNASASQLDLTALLNHTATVEQFSALEPDLDYVNHVFSCMPYILSEVGILQDSTSCDRIGTPDFSSQGSLGVALWYLDFMFYAMSMNVSQVYLHNSLSHGSSAWNPIDHHGSVPHVNGPYYALVFATHFYANTSGLRVAPVYQSETVTAYAGWEGGKLSKLAVINLETMESQASSSFTAMTSLPADIHSVEIDRLTGPVAGSNENITWAGMTWTAENDGIPVTVEAGTVAERVEGGRVNLSVGASEAILMTFGYQS